MIDNDELAKILHINRDGDAPGFAAHVVRGLYRVDGGGAALRERLDEICDEVSAGHRRRAPGILVLSDRHATAELAPIPSLLLTAAVHHHLIREKTRTKVGLLVEAGDVREVHHVALLIGYGAAAVNPYLAMESVEDLARDGAYVTAEPEKAVRNLIKALGKGVLKVMSQDGHLHRRVLHRRADLRGHRAGAGARRPVLHRHDQQARRRRPRRDRRGGRAAARTRRTRVAASPPAHRELEIGGEYQWRREGEPHLFNPETVFRLQHATRAGRYDVFKQYTALVDEQSERLMTLRGLFRFKDAEAQVARRCRSRRSSRSARSSSGSPPARCRTARSRQEAHETLAIAMNRLGGKSNTGEGGEDADRLHDPERRSAIKQVASGRFGVTSEYLVNADDIQIKMAQGAKPGEGGQLPGHKVYPWIAKTRHSTPGVGLISPAAAPRHLLHRGPRPAHPRPEERQPVGAGARQARRRGRRRHGRRRASPRRTPTWCSSPATTAAPAPRRSPRSSTRARPGSSASPRPSRRCCSTGCATGSSCRPTAR